MAKANEHGASIYVPEGAPATEIPDSVRLTGPGGEELEEQRRKAADDSTEGERASAAPEQEQEQERTAQPDRAEDKPEPDSKTRGRGQAGKR